MFEIGIMVGTGAIFDTHYGGIFGKQVTLWPLASNPSEDWPLDRSLQ